MQNAQYGTLDLKPKSLEDQLKKLRKFFPNVKFEISTDVSEGFVFPLWSSIAPTYEKALEVVFRKIITHCDGKFKNYYPEVLKAGSLRQTKRTMDILEKIYLVQKGENVVVLSSQIGIVHLGKSAEEVVSLTPEKKEVALGAFQVLIIILTHYSKIVGGDDLWISCPGDEIKVSGSVEYTHVPLVCVTKEKMSFCAQEKIIKNAKFGQATACCAMY